MLHTISTDILTQPFSALLGLDVDVVILASTPEDAFGSFKGELDRFLAAGDFAKGAPGSTRWLYGTGFKAPLVICLNLGSEYSGEDVRTWYGSIAQALRRERAGSRLGLQGHKQVAAMTEGLVLGDYTYKGGHTLRSLSLVEPAWGPTLSLFTRAVLTAQAQCWARHVAEQPANLATPTEVCRAGEALLAGLPHVTLATHDAAWAATQRMGAFLSVAAGSDQPARFLEIKYQPDPAYPVLALVGKGITFDAGGISLKPATDMGDMRGDCTGAACVIAATYVIASLKLPVNIVTVCPLTENLPSGKATKPSDVVTARTGETIEVSNTDAEGRLVLCDALAYVEDVYKPKAIVDVATLTGAVGVALGPHYIGGYSRSDNQWAQLEQAGRATGEPLWRLPLDPRYRPMMDSTIADINNASTTREAGSILGAIFLADFVKSENWAHLDIAGVTWSKKEGGYKPRGNTATSVRLLTAYAEAFSKAN